MSDIPSENDITFFAETNFRGQRKRFGIKRPDRRKHVYIIGKTGMGKSTLLENMTIQDIQAGRGVAVVDPHGEYAEKMLDFVPRHRINDVIYFNPADTNFPVAFNIMEKVSEDQRHLVSSGLLGVFKKIFGPDVWSARMEYLLANAILALLEIPGTTILSINRMFGEKDFRRQIVSQLQDPIIKGFWENEFAKYPEQYMREAVGAIQNKVGQFSSNPLIRNVIGQTESPVDMRKIMDEQKIFIVNLSKGKIGEENSRLLGAMLVTKLYLTAMSRVDIAEPERKDFYLFVDEFQNFATESFANILSEARKYRLNLTVAHQYIFQMVEEVQHAIFGNVGTMVVFRVGGEDAEVLEKEFMPEFVIEDLVNQGFKQIYVKLMIDGITSRPFSAETLPPMAHQSESFRDEIIQASRERYGTPRALVESKIRNFTESSSGSMGAPGLGKSVAGMPAGVPVEPLRGGGAGAPINALPAPAKQERAMHETKCAVCGKTVLVPFVPDGRRPVYCEEHMSHIQFRSKGTPVSPVRRDESLSVAPGKPHARVAPPQKPVERQMRPMSLRSLETQSREPRRAHTEPLPPKPKSEAHLSELRKVLEASLKGGSQVPRPALDNEKEEKESAVPVAPEPQSRTLKPGETVRFD